MQTFLASKPRKFRGFYVSSQAAFAYDPNDLIVSAPCLASRSHANRGRGRLAAQPGVASVRCVPRAFTQPRALPAARPVARPRWPAAWASQRPRPSGTKVKSTPGSVSSRLQAYGQSRQRRPASAAWRSVSPARSCLTRTSATRQGGTATGCPSGHSARPRADHHSACQPRHAGPPQGGRGERRHAQPPPSPQERGACVRAPGHRAPHGELRTRVRIPHSEASADVPNSVSVGPVWRGDRASCGAAPPMNT
jgi:hypothetical protein